MALIIIEKSQKPDLEGRRFELIENGDALSIGRDSSNDVALEDSRSSRNHCVVVLEGGNWYLKDQKSRNGTFLKSEKVKKIALQNDAKFQVGSSLLRFLSNEHIDQFQGKEISGCRLEKLLDSTGGVLRYHAWQLALDRGVRLDLVHPRWPGLAERSPSLDEKLKRLLSDLESSKGLNHPGVAPVLRYSLPDERGGGLSLLKLAGMTNLEESLSQLFSTELAVRIRFLKLLAQALWARAEYPALNTPFGLRDIGLDNRGCPWIPAFELSSWLALARGKSTLLPGLVTYFPPELSGDTSAEGSLSSEFTFASLAYNFGAVAYHVLTGKAPMGDGLGAEILDNHQKLSPAPANLLSPGIPPNTVTLLEKLLEKVPAKRPSTIEEIVKPLDEALKQTPPAAAAQAPPVEPPPPPPIQDLDLEDEDDWDVVDAPSTSPTVPPRAAPPPARSVVSRGAGIDWRTMPIWIVFWVLLFFVTKYAVRHLLETNLAP